MKFNEKKFRILKCAQPDAVGYIDDDMALKLMEEGYLEFNPKQNWIKNGYKATEKGIKQYNEWLSAMRKKHGHEWITNEDGTPDCMAFCEGYHNGYKCKKCGFEFCVHCHSENDIPQCGSADLETMSDDSKLDQGMIAMEKSIKESFSS